MKKIKLTFQIPEIDNELIEGIKLLIHNRLGKYVRVSTKESNHPLIDYIQEEFAWLSTQIKNGKIQEPTPQQCEKLKAKYKHSYIIGALQQFENKQYKNHKTIHLTIDNWLRDSKEALNPIKDTIHKKQANEPSHEAKKEGAEKAKFAEWINKK